MKEKKALIALGIAVMTFIVLSAISYQETSKARDVYFVKVHEFVVSDTDLLDYHIDPIEMAECVVDTTGVKMRGTRFDIVRLGQYDLYSTWIDIKLGKTVFTERRDIINFGVKIASGEVHTNFGISYQYCVERVAPFNQQQILEDDDWARKVAINVRLWWNDLWT
jgi:hypothetical protein